MTRKKNIYFGLGPAPTPTKRERTRQRKEFQAGVQRKRTGFRKAREKESGTLFKQLQKDAKPQHARRAKMTAKDESLWRELLRENPMREFPGNLTKTEKAALRKLARLRTMATKKRKRRKKKNGKMPAGLAAYWRKKRAKKNPKKKRARRRMKKNSRPRKRATPKIRRYRRKRAAPKRRRTRRANPVRKRVKVIKAPRGMSGKALRAFARAKAAEYGAPSRIIGR